jgi:Domain of unknown function (DUF4956)
MNEESTQIYQRLFNRLLEYPSEQLSFDLPTFTILLSISLISSLMISVAYLKFYENRSTGSQIHRAFPLLGLSITTLFVCIQFSLPLSLGLLGALSIVRFRTPIKEPEEISFIMLLVATSIAIATHNLMFLVLLLAMASVALVILKRSPGPLRDSMKNSFITVTLRNDDYLNAQIDLISLLDEHFDHGRLDGVTKNDTVSVISYSFEDIKKKNLELVEEKLRSLFPNADYSLYSAKPMVT